MKNAETNAWCIAIFIALTYLIIFLYFVIKMIILWNIANMIKKKKKSLLKFYIGNQNSSELGLWFFLIAFLYLTAVT